MRRVWTAAVVVTVGILAGLSSAMADDAARVTIKTFRFQPTRLEVKVGTQVTWTNADDIRHTVTSGTPGSRDGRFDSGPADRDANFSVTFTEPGTYTYFCDRHESMRGEVQVK